MLVGTFRLSINSDKREAALDKQGGKGGDKKERERPSFYYLGGGMNWSRLSGGRNWLFEAIKKRKKTKRVFGGDWAKLTDSRK